MHQLELQHYPQTGHLFGDLPLSLVVKGVIAGNSQGMIWVDQPEQPTVAVLWDGTHSFYLAGVPDNPGLNQNLREFITDHLLPTSLPFNNGVFKLYYPSDTWKAIIPELFHSSTLIQRERCLYSVDPASSDSTEDSVNDTNGYSTRLIDQTLLANTNLQHLDDLTGEINSCWTAMDRFLEYGFGFCMVHEDTIAGWCTAEYVSPGICGIGIETVEAYQQQGIATRLARSMIAYCRQQNIQPHWDAWATNRPSIRVAEKAGLQKVLDYSIYFSYGKG
jgi:RimJ/RimL family protein N-acetyltransferase